MANVTDFDVVASKTVSQIGTQAHIVIRMGSGLYATAYMTVGGDKDKTFLTLRIIQDPDAKNSKTIVRDKRPETLRKGRILKVNERNRFPESSSCPHSTFGAAAVQWNRELVNSMKG